LEEKISALIEKLKKNTIQHPYSQIDSLISDNEEISKLNEFLIKEINSLKNKNANNVILSYRLDSILSYYSSTKYNSKKLSNSYSIYTYNDKIEIYIKHPTIEILENIIQKEKLSENFYIFTKNKNMWVSLQDKEKLISYLSKSANIKLRFKNNIL
jgi:hypothetical protein